jgi:hypothetical protein
MYGEKTGHLCQDELEAPRHSFVALERQLGCEMGEGYCRPENRQLGLLDCHLYAGFSAQTGSLLSQEEPWEQSHPGASR